MLFIKLSTSFSKPSKKLKKHQKEKPLHKSEKFILKKTKEIQISADNIKEKVKNSFTEAWKQKNKKF